MNSNHPNLSPQSIEALDDFMGLVQVSSFKKNLRKLLFYYLINEYEEPNLSFRPFLEDLSFLFDLLDVLEAEQKN